MRPAWSIIFFTTISGLGLGLAGWIVLGLLPLMTPASVMGVGIGTLALIGIGLISSTFHLGHPERAWRALSHVSNRVSLGRCMCMCKHVGVCACAAAERAYRVCRAQVLLRGAGPAAYARTPVPSSLCPLFAA